MAEPSPSQTVKIASLEAARALYFVMAALSVREALLFALGTSQMRDPVIPAGIRWCVAFGYLSTLFRYSHGIAVVYETEKQSARTSTSPSLKRVEWLFAAFSLEAGFFFLMANNLSRPFELVVFTLLMFAADIMYVAASKAIRGHLAVRILPLTRLTTTSDGSPARAHVVWALTNWALGLLMAVTLAPRPALFGNPGTGSSEGDWLLSLAVLFVLGTAADYTLNGRFYFGGKSPRRARQLVFVVTTPAEGTEISTSDARRLLWYCRQLFSDDHALPLAPDAFYSYFLHDAAGDRELGRRCALGFLERCDELRLYTPNGKSDALTSWMTDCLERAKREGLTIRFMGTAGNEPPTRFEPSWGALGASAEDAPKDINFDIPGKRVFICSPLRGGASQGTIEATIRENVRRTQWLCHWLIRTPGKDKELQEPVAPHAFYPYFAYAEEVARDATAWLDGALEVLPVCDEIHVYTESGYEDAARNSPGMNRCLREAERLGLQVRYRRWPQEEWERSQAEWRPAAWSSIQPQEGAVAATAGVANMSA